MRLSDLVAYLNHLDTFRTQQASQAMTQHLDPLVHAVTTHALQFGSVCQDLTQVRNQIDQCLQEFDTGLDRLKQHIRHNIDALEPHYLSESYRLYSEGMVHDSDEVILDRRPELEADVVSYLRARLMRHSDWHYPAMILRPGRESWIQDLVALDPLYLVDTRASLLQPSLETFPPEYRNRVRCYVAQDSDQDPVLHMLPRQQMSLVLVYNYFHYKPLEIIRKLLAEIYDCLRPGGTVMFTFNDCDRAGAVELAERYYMCYTPGRLILASAELQGYEIVHTYTMDAAATWVELRRPGQLQNIRGGQTLAKIVAKNKIS